MANLNPQKRSLLFAEERNPSSTLASALVENSPPVLSKTDPVDVSLRIAVVQDLSPNVYALRTFRNHNLVQFHSTVVE